MQRIRKYTLFYGIAILYMAGALVFKEFHPFSRFPMYSELPNWSYAFYFVDENDKLIPCEQLNYTGGKLGHLFYSVAGSEHINIGNGIESKEELNLIGRKMTDHVLSRNQPINHKIIKLKRKHFYYINNRVNTTEQLVYEKNLD